MGKTLKEAGCVAATLTALSTSSVVQITTTTVMQKVGLVQPIQCVSVVLVSAC